MITVLVLVNNVISRRSTFQSRHFQRGALVRASHSQVYKWVSVNRENWYFIMVSRKISECSAVESNLWPSEDHSEFGGSSVSNKILLCTTNTKSRSLWKGLSEILLFRRYADKQWITVQNRNSPYLETALIQGSGTISYPLATLKGGFDWGMVFEALMTRKAKQKTKQWQS